MFPMQAMFGNFDQKTMKDMLMDNEEALEKVMEYIPVIKDELQKQRERDALGEVDPNIEEGENEEDGEHPKQGMSRAEHNETTFEKIKRGITNLFGMIGGTKPEGDVLPKDEEYTAVQIKSPEADQDNRIKFPHKTETMQPLSITTEHATMPR